MDKCILSNNDVAELFRWRDRNVDLVCRAACPIKGIEIVLPDVPARIKYVRNDNIVSIHYVLNEKEKFNYTIRISYHPMYNMGYTIVKKPTKGFGTNEQFIHDIVAMYYAIMALIAYGDDTEYTEQELDIIDREIIPRKNDRHAPAKRDSIIYLFNKEPSGRLRIRRKGERKSPSGQFNVRGHFRHLRNGKTIWIAEYKKGTGKKKSKTYKL